jgi:hypothetical protein
MVSNVIRYVPGAKLQTIGHVHDLDIGSTPASPGLQ